MEDFIRTILGGESGYAFVSRASGKTANGKLNVNIHNAFQYPQQFGEMVKYAREHAGEDVYLSPLLYG